MKLMSSPTKSAFSPNQPVILLAFLLFTPLILCPTLNNWSLEAVKRLMKLLKLSFPSSLEIVTDVSVEIFVASA